MRFPTSIIAHLFRIQVLVPSTTTKKSNIKTSINNNSTYTNTINNNSSSINTTSITIINNNRTSIQPLLPAKHHGLEVPE